MALISDAAMVLFYDIEGEDADHDDWHSHEHFAERLSVPGFLRATRWVALDGGPRNLVIYEVTGTDVATSEAYLDRLNNPTPWTQAMMPRFRGMIRGFCDVVASAGFGLGGEVLALRFAPGEGTVARLEAMLPELAVRRGLVGAHLLRPAPPPPMTREQALRGKDQVMPWLLVVMGYEAAFEDVEEMLRGAGAGEVIAGRYRMHYTAAEGEAAQRRG